MESLNESTKRDLTFIKNPSIQVVGVQVSDKGIIHSNHIYKTKTAHKPISTEIIKSTTKSQYTCYGPKGEDHYVFHENMAGANKKQNVIVKSSKTQSQTKSKTKDQRYPKKSSLITLPANVYKHIGSEKSNSKHRKFLLHITLHGIFCISNNLMEHLTLLDHNKIKNDASKYYIYEMLQQQCVVFHYFIKNNKHQAIKKLSGGGYDFVDNIYDIDTWIYEWVPTPRQLIFGASTPNGYKIKFSENVFFYIYIYIYICYDTCHMMNDCEKTIRISSNVCEINSSVIKHL